MMNQLCLAYLLPAFPKLSETFISREILNLHNMGYQIKLFAFKQSEPDELAQCNSEVQSFTKQVQYISHTKVIMSLLQGIMKYQSISQLNHQLQQSITNKTNPYMRLGRTLAIAQQIERLGITHLHAHWPYATQIAALVHRLTGISYSVSIHAHEVAHENSHFPIVFETLSFASFCNRAAMEFLMSQLPSRYQSKAHLIYHGVNVDEFTMSDIPYPPSPLRVISAGRLTATKGFNRLIEGCARAVQAGLDIELTILGQGTLYDKLQHQGHQLGLSNRLKMPGWVPHNKVRDYLTQAHLFALLADTTYHDGLPNVALEAMACGRPVILSPLPAISEAVTDSQDGFILKGSDDIDGLVNALRQFIEYPHKLSQMGRSAQSRVTNEHSDQIHIQRLAKLFEACHIQELENVSS